MRALFQACLVQAVSGVLAFVQSLIDPEMGPDEESRLKFDGVKDLPSFAISVDFSW
jgi:hypothetical protein